MIPQYIILHHSLTKDGSTVSWDAIRRYHTQTLHWNDIGYHAGIELIGNTYEVLFGRMLNVLGAHTRGLNSISLGICFIGNFDIATVPVEQWNLGIKLVRSLREIFSIPINHVKGHRDYADYKSCPGKLFDVSQFRKDLIS